MQRNTVYAALDVGTSKICTIVASRRPDGEADVLGVGIAPSQGIRKGVVVNIQEARAAVRASLDEAERSAAVTIPSVHVGITGSHLELFHRWGTLRIPDYNAALTADDISSAVEAAFPRDLPPEKQVLHLIPQSYAVDGLNGVRNPIGMHASKLDVQTLCVVVATPPIQHLVHTVEGARVKVRGVVMAGLASGEAVLKPDEKEAGVVLVEIGAGATTIAVFQESTLRNAAVLPVGGHQFTTDLAAALNAPYEVAEEAKIRYGSAMHESIGDERVELRAFGDLRTVKIERRELCRYLHDRAEEIMRLSYMKTRELGYAGTLPAGLVLTGGAANLPNIASVARNIFNTPVRVGTPTSLAALPDALRDPAYAACAGTALWSIRHAAERGQSRAGAGRGFTSPGGGNSGGGPIGWLREQVRRVAL